MNTVAPTKPPRKWKTTKAMLVGECNRLHALACDNEAAAEWWKGWTLLGSPVAFVAGVALGWWLS